MFLKSIYTLLGFFLFNISVQAQLSTMLFGAQDINHFNIKSFQGDSSISAIVLDEAANLRFNDCEDLIMDYHVRILIINENGFNNATIKFMLYNMQEFKIFRAETYNLVDGKIITSSLTKENIIDQNVEAEFTTKSFNFPDVKAGSIIEYQYTIGIGNYIRLKSWYFQREIPVIKSSYSISIPEFFNYTLMPTDMKGKLKFTSINKTASFCGMNTSTNIHKWKVDSIPALIEEPYANNIENYGISLEFLLKTVIIPQYYSEYLVTNYITFGKKLLDSDNFTLRYKNLLFSQDILKKLQLDSLSEIEKVQRIYAFVQNEMNWNEHSKMYAYFPLRNAFLQKKGSSADINLLLCGLLQDANIDASPVILSSRDSKLINQYSYTPNRFNYVIVCVNTIQDTILLDATEKFAPIGELPERCLNGEGLYINKYCKWIPLYTNEKHNTTTFIKYNFDEKNQLQGKASLLYKNLDATALRSKIYNAGSIENYKQTFIEKNQNIEISSFSIIQDSNYNNPVKINADFILKDGVDFIGDEIIISPFILHPFNSNPFIAKERFTTIDFICPFERNIIVNFTLPAGYTIVSVPQNQKFSLYENDATCTFNVRSDNTMIQINSKVLLNKTIYFPQDYEAVKQFYDYIIANFNQKIILKKI